MFFRLHTDRTRQAVDLTNVFAAPGGASVFLCGGSPGLAEAPLRKMEASRVPILAMNNAVTLVRPNLWNAVDLANRFVGSLYRDPTVLKFMPTSRFDNLVPGADRKVCEMPGMLFYELDPQVGYADFLSPNERVVWWNDTMIASIQILHRLGFRHIYTMGVSLAMSADKPYAFDEQYDAKRAANCHHHYQTMGHRLRLLRSYLELGGLSITSCTPDSMLNDFLPYRPAQEVVAELALDVAGPDDTSGLYSQGAVPHQAPSYRFPMKDVGPPSPKGTSTAKAAPPAAPDDFRRRLDALEAARSASPLLDREPAVEVKQA
jgi:hypothetical protein